MKRKIKNYTTISMDFISSSGNSDIKPFSDKIKTLLTSTTDRGWELDGAISTALSTYTITTKVDNKDVTNVFVVKSLSASLTQYETFGGF